MLFIRSKHNIWIFRVVCFIRLQNDTWTTVKRWEMRCRTKTVICFWLSYVVFMSSAWKKVYKDWKWRVWGRVLLVCPPLECHWLVLCWVAEEKELVQELAALPIGRDTVRVRNKRKEVESKLTELEEAIKIFSRPKVFVKVDPWNCPAHSCWRYVISMESVNASGCHCLGVAALPVTRSVPALLVTGQKSLQDSPLRKFSLVVGL